MPVKGLEGTFKFNLFLFCFANYLQRILFVHILQQSKSHDGQNRGSHVHCAAGACFVLRRIGDGACVHSLVAGLVARHVIGVQRAGQVHVLVRDTRGAFVSDFNDRGELVAVEVGVEGEQIRLAVADADIDFESNRRGRVRRDHEGIGLRNEREKSFVEERNGLSVLGGRDEHGAHFGRQNRDALRIDGGQEIRALTAHERLLENHVFGVLEDGQVAFEAQVARDAVAEVLGDDDGLDDI